MFVLEASVIMLVSVVLVFLIGDGIVRNIKAQHMILNKPIIKMIMLGFDIPNKTTLSTWFIHCHYGDGMLLFLCEMGVVLWKEEGWVVYMVGFCQWMCFSGV